MYMCTCMCDVTVYYVHVCVAIKFDFFPFVSTDVLDFG